MLHSGDWTLDILRSPLIWVKNMHGTPHSSISLKWLLTFGLEFSPSLFLINAVYWNTVQFLVLSRTQVTFTQAVSVWIHNNFTPAEAQYSFAVLETQTSDPQQRKTLLKQNISSLHKNNTCRSITVVPLSAGNNPGWSLTFRNCDFMFDVSASLKHPKTLQNFNVQELSRQQDWELYRITE